MTDFASIYETNVLTIKQDHLSTNSIHVSTCQWRRKQVESEWGGGGLSEILTSTKKDLEYGYV